MNSVATPAVLATMIALAAGTTIFLMVTAVVSRRIVAPETRSAVRCSALIVLLVAPLASLVMPTLVTVRSSAPQVVGAVIVPVTTAARQALRSSADPSRRAPARHQLSRWLFVLWCVGAGLLALRILVSILALLILRTRSREIEAPVQLLQLLRSRSGVSRHVRVRISTTTTPHGAMTWGGIRPKVVLPSSALDWPSEQRVAVLLHEFAHIRRFDVVWRMLGVVATTVYWFNPLVWQLASEVNADAELCADDTVLAGGVRATDYAAVLLGFARDRHRASSLAVGFGGGALETRITRILESTSPCRTTRRPLLAMLALIAVSIGVLAGTVRAEPSVRRDSDPLFDVTVDHRLATLPAHVARRFESAQRTATTLKHRLQTRQKALR